MFTGPPKALPLVPCYWPFEKRYVWRSADMPLAGWILERAVRQRPSVRLSPYASAAVSSTSSRKTPNDVAPITHSTSTTTVATAEPPVANVRR